MVQHAVLQAYPILSFIENQDEIEAAWTLRLAIEDRNCHHRAKLDEAQIRQELDACLVPLDRLHEN